MYAIIGASVSIASLANKVGIGSSSQRLFVIYVTSLVISSTVTVLKNAIVLELSDTSGLSSFDSVGMDFMILLIFSTIKKSPNKLHNSYADLLDGRGLFLDFPSSMTLWTTETAVWCFPDLIVVSLLLVNKSIHQVACLQIHLSVDNRACLPPESFCLSVRLLSSFASRIDSLYHSASEMEWQQYRGRMYNKWNGRNTEGGCTIYGTAEIRREDVQ